MVKWRLMLTTLPVVVLAVLLKLFVFDRMPLGGVLEFSDLAFVLTGGVFLVGFMLAGTMSDYKEAERLPGEVVCALETIEETFEQAAANKASLDALSLRILVRETADTIDNWLYRRASYEQVCAALEGLAHGGQALEKVGVAPPIGVRVVNELHGLRRNLTRMHVISRTGFLSTGYALLETLTVVIVGLLMIARFKSMLAEGLLVALITLIYVYMIRLIRDIDDPFEYSDRGVAGAAEVDLEVLHAYRKRLASRTKPNVASPARLASARPAAPAATIPS
ncbi:MAG TPA: hypothetical protein VKP30_20720 [Polyangiaceae bacterium]|nr:hypothetical protein [Polyangiaceae bacterium]